MDTKIVLGRTMANWFKELPLLRPLVEMKPIFWANDSYRSSDNILNKLPLTKKDVADAEQRLLRFAPYISRAFPETAKSKGIIESPVREISRMKKALAHRYTLDIPGTLLLKCDSHLPISGSIKARGGIYAVLKHAETLAMEHGLLKQDDDYSVLAEADLREFFSQYSIAVGSTGNLGLSIGIMSARLGFKVYVHMSSDAKQWKKDMLRSKGVTVVEYDSDYSHAVAEGRRQAESDPTTYFIDDENSTDLFLGYAVAASRLKKQLDTKGIQIDKDHPLFVYLPCGVGGGPGGVALGLKHAFGDAVHCFFAEPTHSPCMVLGMMTGLHDRVSVQDFGIDNITAADGLAVGRPSGFVGKIMMPLISGCYTLKDETLYLLLATLAETEEILLEPSALAGMKGIVSLLGEEAGRSYLEKHGLMDRLDKAVHIAWGTGGSMVPDEEMLAYIQLGKEYRQTQW